MRRLFAMLAVLAFAASLAAGCGGDEKKKGPVYPACETSKDCSDKGEYCYNGTCSECAKTKHCKKKGACLGCTDGKCTGKKNCCTNKDDCPAGSKCIVKPGKKEGTCGKLE